MSCLNPHEPTAHVNVPRPGPPRSARSLGASRAFLASEDMCTGLPTFACQLGPAHSKEFHLSSHQRHKEFQTLETSIYKS